MLKIFTCWTSHLKTVIKVIYTHSVSNAVHFIKRLNKKRKQTTARIQAVGVRPQGRYHNESRWLPEKKEKGSGNTLRNNCRVGLSHLVPSTIAACYSVLDNEKDGFSKMRICIYAHRCCVYRRILVKCGYMHFIN